MEKWGKCKKGDSADDIASQTRLGKELKGI